MQHSIPDLPPTLAPTGFRVWRQTTSSGRTLIGDAVLSETDSNEFVDQAPPTCATEYWLEEVTTHETVIWYGPALLSAATLPTVVVLEQNRPNPFNPLTTIRYSLPSAGRVILAVHDLRGNRIVTLINAEKQAGEWAAEWDGLDDQGAAVSSGVYLTRLETQGGIRTVKMTLAR